MTILSLNNVTKNVYGHKILDSVNYNFSKNSITWIKGDTGSGKTLLSNIMGQIEHTDSGTVNWDVQVLKSISLVFDVPALISNLTIFQNLTLALNHFQKTNKHQLEENKVQELLLEWDLVNTEQLRPVSLSKGQAIKVALIRALIFNPKILIWDDAFECFDEADLKFVQEKLELANFAGCTLILFSRRENIYWNSPSQKLFLDNGRLII